jgi:hypothetical protein
LIQFAEDVKEFALKKAINGHKCVKLQTRSIKGIKKIVDEDAVVKVCEGNWH